LQQNTCTKSRAAPREGSVSWLRRSSAAAGWVALACLLAAGLLFGRSSRPGEYEVKAVYLLNFGKFITWPTAATNSSHKLFPICVLGQDPFGRALDTTVSGEDLGGEEVVARRIREPRDALSCRILFISASEKFSLGAIFEVLGNAPVLTVSDLPGFASRGGMIEFVLEQDRVRFSVNLAATKDAGLTLSSQLLKVASSVEGNAPRGGRR
jgi:YfiR/HmsC-like